MQRLFKKTKYYTLWEYSTDSQWTQRLMQTMTHKTKIILKIVILQGGEKLLERKVKIYHIGKYEELTVEHHTGSGHFTMVLTRISASAVARHLTSSWSREVFIGD